MLKTKFKQTEIGWIPEDWDITLLSEIGTFTKGKGISKSESDTGEIPAIRYGEIYTKHHNIIRKYYSGISQKVAAGSQELKKGDLLFAGSGETREEIGKTIAFVDDFKVYAGSDIVILHPTSNNDSIFLSYALNFGNTQKQKAINGQGDAVVHIYASNLKNIKVPLPSFSEQRAIAETLIHTDEWIESLEKLIAKKRLIKQGVMQKLLTPKKDWEMKKLGDIGEIIIGLTYTPNDVRDWGTLVLRSSNIKNGKLAFENNVFVEMELPSRVIVRENDLLICVRNGSKHLIGKCALIDRSNAGHAFGAFMSVIRSDFNNYIYHYFSSKHIKAQIDENLGATINQLTNATLNSFEIYFPKSIEEQTYITTILSDMDAEIEVLEQKLSKARQIKQGMMQQLLTGKIRLIAPKQTKGKHH